MYIEVGKIIVANTEDGLKHTFNALIKTSQKFPVRGYIHISLIQFLSMRWSSALSGKQYAHTFNISD